MKRIAVFIDFTEGSKTAMQQAVLFAKKHNSVIYAVNIAESEDKVAQTKEDLAQFCSTFEVAGLELKVEVMSGDLFAATPLVLKRIDPHLVFVCTHGVKGLKQHLFGSHILKFVQTIHYPSIVIQENNQVKFDEVKTILFPLGPHPDYMIKIESTAEIAKAFSAKVILYEIDKPGLDGDPQLDINRKNARTHFENNGISFESVVEEMKVVSAGFSRQTLEYAKENGISLISLMATVSKNDLLFGTGDKESMLVNPLGIPVLCCHQ
jgi:hypothetical protein